MTTPSEEVRTFTGLMQAARDFIDQKRWNDALDVLKKATELDRLHPGPYEHLGTVYEALGQPEEARFYRSRAKAIREEIWKREVEAEIRGHHEMIGEASRHEIP